MKKTLIAPTIVGICLLAVGGFATTILFRQRMEIRSLHAQLVVQHNEIDSLRTQLAVRPTNRLSLQPPTSETIPPATDPNAFANVAESAIPGRYRWTQSDQEKGILTLFPDHTFESHKGEKFVAYRWKLSRDRLVLQWNIGSIHFTSIESPGIYVGVRTDGQAERMEKVE